MKRYILLAITIFFGMNMRAQIAPSVHLTTSEYDVTNYIKDCNEKEMAALREDSSFGLEEEEPLRIYPNPTTEYISVTNNSSVAYLYIYNIIGRRVKSFPVFAGGQYSLRDLPDGIYLISLVDQNGKILKTIRSSKSVPRP